MERDEAERLCRPYVPPACRQAQEILEGGGGHVTVPAEPGAETSLELEIRKWDYAVKQFMAQVQQCRHC